MGALAVVVALAGALAGRASIVSSGPGGAAAASGVAAKVDPGLVDIDTELGLEGTAAAGTGMILTPSGEVLTNNHVIEGATSVSVTDIGNGRTYSATVVGTDKASDVAVLQMSGAAGLATVRLGDSSKLSIGEAVTAIGNAGGSGGTPSVTTGDVTALDQAITASDEVDGSTEELSGLVETNAALQPGDSGGPLVDNSARVVAIDTAASAGFEFQSGSRQSYSVPIDYAASIARQIEDGEASSTVHIGPAAFLGLWIEPSPTVAGAQVARVEDDSPASQAGIVAGDVITSLGGQPVDSADVLSNLMQSHHPGDSVRVGWVDPLGRQHSATVVLAVGPAA